MKQVSPMPMKCKTYVSDFTPVKLERNCAKMQTIQKRLKNSRKKIFIHLEVSEKR